MSRPYAIVALSSATYASLLKTLLSQDDSRSHDKARSFVKLISSCHALAATGITVLALSQTWTIPISTPPSAAAFFNRYDHSSTQESGKTQLNDSTNPLIAGTNPLANFVTAWEAGYLIYDTAALLYLETRRHSSHKPLKLTSALRHLLQNSPVFLAHHALLVAALLYLQTYIAANREKGLRVIMAFSLMNASNPLLHLRWWRRKTTGRSDVRIDVALAVAFAVTRFGSVFWVMRQYGMYHGLNPWDASVQQRWQCKVGTGLLTIMNAVWWLGLVSRIAHRTRGQKMS